MIKRKVIGHKYTSTKSTGIWSVESDYLNGRIYLGCPEDDADVAAAEEFAKAILRAVHDQRLMTEGN